jgi:glutathione S-transferase
LHKSLMTPLLDSKASDEVKAYAVRRYESRLGYLDQYLAGREFLLDRFTVADAYLATVLGWTQATPEIELAKYPAVRAYLDRMRQRPSVAAALGVEIPLFRAEIARHKAA